MPWNFTLRLPMSRGCTRLILGSKNQRSRSQCIDYWKWWISHSCSLSLNENWWFENHNAVGIKVIKMVYIWKRHALCLHLLRSTDKVGRHFCFCKVFYFYYFLSFFLIIIIIVPFQWIVTVFLLFRYETSIFMRYSRFSYQEMNFCDLWQKHKISTYLLNILMGRCQPFD